MFLFSMFSNHGGRQVDSAPPAIQLLSDIVKVVNGRAEGKKISSKLKLCILNDCTLFPLFLVFVDTGIRTGTDILKALALGARGVLIGRPVLYGLACGGHDGVKTVLNIFKRELKYDMACCGITSIDQINKDILYTYV